MFNYAMTMRIRKQKAILYSCWCVLTFGFMLFPARAIGGKAEPISTFRILDEDQTLTELRSYLHDLVTEYVPPQDAAFWREEAEMIRERLLEEIVFRGVPESWREYEPRIVWDERIPGDGYSIRKLRYEVVPGLWAGALFYEPQNLDGKVPAILNVNGHEREEGMKVAYKQQRCVNQVKRGMLALNLEWIGMGQLNTPGFSHNAGSYLDLCGRSGLSIFYFALKHGLDILLSHKAADPNQIAVTGLSGGGWQTIFISALDPRVMLAVPNAGYIGIHYRIEFPEDIGDFEQCPTDFHTIADYVHLTAMLYPRPALLIYNASDQCCFQADRARESVFEPVRPLYEHFGHPDRFDLHINIDPGTHNYLLDNQRALYRFINRHFRPPNPDIEDDLCLPEEILDEKALAIEYPEDQLDFLKIAEEIMTDLPEKMSPNTARSALKKCIRLQAELPVRLEEIKPQALPSTLENISARAWRAHLGESWTLPVVTLEPSGGAKQGTTLLVAELDASETIRQVERILTKGERVLAANILLMGECRPTEGRLWQYSLLIATLGRRALGIQATQLMSLISYIEDNYPGEPIRLIANGRTACMAALVTAALKPGGLKEVKLHGLDSSLKDLVRKNVDFNDAAPLLCFGLLEIADISHLIYMSAPTEIALFEPPPPK